MIAIENFWNEYNDKININWNTVEKDIIYLYIEFHSTSEYETYASMLFMLCITFKIIVL